MRFHERFSKGKMCRVKEAELLCPDYKPSVASALAISLDVNAPFQTLSAFPRQLYTG